MSGRICNDLEQSVISVLSEPEWISLCELYFHFNGDPENFDPKRFNLSYDWLWITWGAIRLVEQAMALEPNMVLTHPSAEVQKLVKKVKALKERTAHLEHKHG